MLTLLLAVAIANPSAEATSPTAVRVHAVLTGEAFAPSVFYRVTGSRIWTAVLRRSAQGAGSGAGKRAGWTSVVTGGSTGERARSQARSPGR